MESGQGRGVTICEKTVKTMVFKIYSPHCDPLWCDLLGLAGDKLAMGWGFSVDFAGVPTGWKTTVG